MRVPSTLTYCKVDKFGFYIEGIKGKVRYRIVKSVNKTLASFYFCQAHDGRRGWWVEIKIGQISNLRVVISCLSWLLIRFRCRRTNTKWNPYCGELLSISPNKKFVTDVYPKNPNKKLHLTGRWFFFGDLRHS